VKKVRNAVIADRVMVSEELDEVPSNEADRKIFLI